MKNFCSSCLFICRNIFLCGDYLYLCKRMERGKDIQPINALFLNIKKRDEFDF